VRLSRATLARLRPGIAVPEYDFAAQKAGIVHFGIGAFHRAHQAWYTDTALNAGDRDWGITGVSLRSAGVAAQMNPQDGLYSLSERSGDGVSARIIGAAQQVLVASEEHASAIAAVASPDTHIVSFTVTEKGYCRAADGSLDQQSAAGGFYPLIANALRARRDAGLSGLTLLSCDNLASNGAQLHRLMSDYLTHQAPDLFDWFTAECTCPSTMVDRIVPATTEEDRADVAAALGLTDQAAVVTEPFSQWVIEDKFVGPRPRWEIGGAQFTNDVAPFETAKLRMLNGAHSALAYLGLARGHVYVHQAIADPALRPLIETLMRDEAAASLTPAPGQDLDGYAQALLARFANPALDHKLIQIAMDGSQKIPQRWLETLAFHQLVGRECPAILAGLGAWLTHTNGANGPVNDPLAETFAALWRTGSRADVASALFGSSGHFAASWVAGPTALASIARQR
jgi:fructuronate reductase